MKSSIVLIVHLYWLGTTISLETTIHHLSPLVGHLDPTAGRANVLVETVAKEVMLVGRATWEVVLVWEVR